MFWALYTLLQSSIKKGKRAEAIKEALGALNSEIDSLLSQIETNANEFIKKHFVENKDVIRITLQFSKRFAFEKIKQKLWQPGKGAVSPLTGDFLLINLLKNPLV